MNFFSKVYKIFVLAFSLGCFVYEPAVFANSEQVSVQKKSDEKKDASLDKDKLENNAEQVDKKKKLEESSGTKEFLVEIAGCIVLGICIGALRIYLRKGCK